MLALALPLSGSSCSERSCEGAEDCAVGEICGRGRICAPRECGFVVDGSVIDSCGIASGGGVRPGYRCIEGVCQIVSTDYLDASGRPPLPGSDSGQTPVNDSGQTPVNDSGAPPADTGAPGDAGQPAGADVP